MKFSPIHQTMVLTLQLPDFLLAISRVHVDGSSCSIQPLIGLYAKLQQPWTTPQNLCTLTCSMANFKSMVNHGVDYHISSEALPHTDECFVTCVHTKVFCVNEHS